MRPGGACRPDRGASRADDAPAPTSPRRGRCFAISGCLAVGDRINVARDEAERLTVAAAAAAGACGCGRTRSSCSSPTPTPPTPLTFKVVSDMDATPRQ
jgi:hypothetical protein